MNPNQESTSRSDFGTAVFEQLMQGARFAAYSAERLAEGGAIAAVRALVDMQLDAAASTLDVVRGDRDPFAAAGELGSRTRSGLRYDLLVQTLGRELFGSGRLQDEVVLAEDRHFRLVYVPAKKGAPALPPLFHLGGVLPYGDQLFRLLPELCFYERFTSRGMPVYAMELKGDRGENDYQDLTLEGVIDAVSHFSGLALDHARGQKLVLEAAVGLASHALAYVCARPLEANARFKVVGTFVGPVDGTRCERLAGIMGVMPESVVEGSYRLAEMMGTYVSGDNLRTTQDLALNGFFAKTPLGRFATGWKRPEYAAVDGVASLTPEQRKDLTGQYWISAENCRRWPVPVDLSRYSANLFTRGVTSEGVLPGSYQGRPLSIADALANTSLQFVGFYGGKDVLVPESTAEVMKRILGDRYTHVLHPDAGHVSYIFSPKLWDPANPKGLKPNPVDVLLEAYGPTGEAKAEKKAESKKGKQERH